MLDVLTGRRLADLTYEEVAEGVALSDDEEALIERLTADWAGMPVELPEHLESLPVNARLARMVFCFDLEALNAADRVRYLRACERLTAAVQARSLAAVNSTHDSYTELGFDDAKEAYDGAGFELRSALRWTRRAAEAELDLAADLTVRLPAVLAMLRSRRIDRRRAKLIRDRTSHVSVGHARQLADQVLGEAPRLTTGQLAARIRRAALEADPDSCREESRKAREARLFFTQPEPDGTASIHLYGIDPVRAQELSDRINRIARTLRGDGEARRIDQLRADIAVGLLCGTGQPTLGTVHLTVSLAELFDPDIATAAELAGYGPILGDIARQVTEAELGSWDWTVTNPDTGMPVADGHTRRRHTVAQRRRIARQHPRCVAPGCRMPTMDCDIDHSTPYAESGVTDAADSAPLCRHDHCVRHQSGWTYTHRPDGDIVWTSPLGTTYTTSGRDP